MNKLMLLALLLLASCANMQSQTGSDGTTGISVSARKHTDLGSAYYEEKQYAIALEEFNVAIKYDPSYAPAYNGLGLVHSVLGQDDKADSNFKRAIQLNGDYSEAHNNYGAFLCSRTRYDESVGQFLSAVKNPLYTTPYLAYLNAGLCSLRKKDEKNAEIYFRNAVQIEPLLHRASYEIAKMEFKRGEHLQARNTLQNALITNPTADMLWLGVQIERILGDRNAEASYSLQLRKKYPESAQTKAMLSGE